MVSLVQVVVSLVQVMVVHEKEAVHMSHELSQVAAPCEMLISPSQPHLPMWAAQVTRHGALAAGYGDAGYPMIAYQRHCVGQTQTRHAYSQHLNRLLLPNCLH